MITPSPSAFACINPFPENARLFTVTGAIFSGVSTAFVINEKSFCIASIGATEDASVVWGKTMILPSKTSLTAFA